MKLANNLKNLGYRDRIALARAVKYYSTKIAPATCDRWGLQPIASHARLARKIETYTKVEQDLVELLINAARNKVPVCGIAGIAYSYAATEHMIKRIDDDEYIEKCLVWYANCVTIPHKLRDEARDALERIRD